MHAALAFSAALIVQHVFARGTGAVVRVHRPTISYFPLRAAIHKVTAFTPEEGKHAGYRAREVSVQIRFVPLFSKRVVIQLLQIKDAEIISRGENTAFVRTLEFLFGKKEKPQGQKWHSFLTAGWHVWIPEVKISTKAGVGKNLIVGTDDFTFDFDQASFSTRDTIDHPTSPVRIAASGKNIALHFNNDESRSIGSAEATGKILSNVITIEDGLIRTDQEAGGLNTVKMTGALTTGSDGAFDFSYQTVLNERFLNRFFTLKPGNRLAQTSVELGGRLLGPLNLPVAEGSARIASLGLDSAPFTTQCRIQDASASFAVDARRLRLQDFALEDFVNSGSLTMNFDETLEFSAEAAVKAEIDGQFVSRCFGRLLLDRTDGTSPGKLQTADVMLLQLKSKGRLSPMLGSAWIDADFRDKEGIVLSHLSSDLSLAGGVLAVSAKEGGTAAGSLDLQGTINPGNMEINVTRLKLLRYPFFRFYLAAAPFSRMLDVPVFDKNTTLDGEASFRTGPAGDNAAGSGVLHVRHFAGPAAELEHLETRLRLQGGRIWFDDVSMQAAGGEVQGEAAVGFDGSLTGALRTRKLSLSDFKEYPQLLLALGRWMSGEARISGRLSEPLYEGELDLQTETVGQGTKVRFSGDRAAVHLAGSAFGDSLTADAYLPLDAGAVKLQARARGFDLARMLSPDRFGIVSGSLAGELNYSGMKSNLLLGQGEITLPDIQLKGDGWTLRQAAPVTVRIENGRLNFNAVRFLVNERELLLAGFLDQQTGWHAAVKGTAVLSSQLAEIPAVEDLSGSLLLDAALSGPTLRPDISGRLRLEGGGLSFPAGRFDVGIHDAQGEVHFTGDRFELRGFTAAMGQGAISANGGGENLYDAAKRNIRLNAHFNNILLEPLRELTLTFQGGLAYRKEGSEAGTVAGDLLVKQLLYENNINLAGVLKSLTRTVLGINTQQKQFSRPIDEAVGSTKLDVRINGSNNLVIDTNVAQAEVKADLRLAGTIADPRLEGEIKAVEGSFGFKANQFQLLNAELAFDAGSLRPDPRLNILGETILRTATGEEQQVRLSIGGTLTDPHVRFLSEAGLSQNEILSSLGVSAPVGNVGLFGGKAQDRTVRELISPGSDLSLKDRLSGLTGFKDVQVESGLSRTTGEFVPKVEATRRLTSKVDLTIVSELTSQQASEFEVGYPLTPFLTLVNIWRSTPASQDVTSKTGTYGVGVKYRKTFPGLLFWAPARIKQRSAGDD